MHFAIIGHAVRYVVLQQWPMTTTLDKIQRSIHRVGEARERLLKNRSIDSIISTLAQAAKRWLDPTGKWRLLALEQAPAATGFSEAMVHEAIDLCFGVITHDALTELLDRELGDRRVLDQFCVRGQLRTRAIGPRLITHFLAGNVPAPGIVSICCGLLLKAGNLVKASQGEPIFPALFVESLRDIDAELADCVAVLQWPRDEVVLTQAALFHANAVIAYGDDQTVSTLRRMAPAAVFLGYGHKVSFGVVAKEAMAADNLPSLAEAAAFDVSVYDQQGCLSPHLIYVEEGGQSSARNFAARLAEAMAAFQARIPRGELSLEEAAAIAKIRGAYEFRAAADGRVSIWSSPGTKDWTVIYDEDPSFVPSCLNRVVFIKPIEDFKCVLEVVQSCAGKVSTVGIAPMNERIEAFAGDLAKLGVHRVCSLGQMQRPPLAWHHDGRPNLADLVRWMDAG
jgi:hypothetical protein